MRSEAAGSSTQAKISPPAGEKWVRIPPIEVHPTKITMRTLQFMLNNNYAGKYTVRASGIPRSKVAATAANDSDYEAIKLHLSKLTVGYTRSGRLRQVFFPQEMCINSCKDLMQPAKLSLKMVGQILGRVGLDCRPIDIRKVCSLTSLECTGGVIRLGGRVKLFVLSVYNPNERTTLGPDLLAILSRLERPQPSLCHRWRLEREPSAVGVSSYASQRE